MTLRSSLLGLGLASAVACGGRTPTPTNPSPATTTTTTAPVVVNTPPKVGAFTVQGSRTNEPPNFADVSEEVPVSVEVTDADPAVADVKFNWSSSPPVGTFLGTGSKVTWKAPATVAAPEDVSLNLEVVETFSSAGQPVQNKVTGSTSVSLHDSIKEVGDMARQFLLDFSDSSIKDVPHIMRNFQPDCYGTSEETGQVADNRVYFQILPGWRVEPAATTVQFGGFCPFRNKQGDACAQVRTFWKSRVLKNVGDLVAGQITNASGVDQVAAMYNRDQQRWWLCDSQFNGDEVSQTSLKAMLHGLVP